MLCYIYGEKREPVTEFSICILYAKNVNEIKITMLRGNM